MTAGGPWKLAREMVSPSKGAGNSTEPLVEKLRAMRRDALHWTEEAEAEAQQARIEAKVYSEAAQALNKRAYEADAQARQFDAQGDPKEAAAVRRTAADIRKLAEQNYGVADKKGAIAAGFEREAYHHRSLAAEFEAQIKQKMKE